MVATAPSTTSMRMMKMKNRISAVEQPIKPQKILRASASRNVSRTKAAVAMADLLGIDSPHENIFQRAVGARDAFDLALLGAQRINCPVRILAAGKLEFDEA